MVDTVNQEFLSVLIFNTFSLQLRSMIFSASNDGIEWSLEFGSDSFTRAVKDLVQEMTISCQEIPLAAWSLLLSQRQDFLNNQLARVPVIPTRKGLGR